jgi:hypothetical protein
MPTRVAFRSKRDRRIVLLAWSEVALIALAVFAFSLGRNPFGEKVAVAAFGVWFGAWSIWRLYGTRYLFGDRELVIWSGPVRQTIALGDIVEVVPMNERTLVELDPILAFVAGRIGSEGPALSYDRLRISLRRGEYYYMAYPSDPAAFLDALTIRAPHLRREGDRLVR